MTTRTATSAPLAGAVRAVAVRPRLWPAAIVMCLRLARPGWWRRWPPIPYPDSRYWRFRMETAYGGTGESEPDPDDVVAYLEWCRQQWHRPRRVGG